MLRLVAANRFALLAPVLLALAITLACKPNRSATSSTGKPWEEFSGENALSHVQHLVDFGPRPPASEAIEKSRDYIVTQLEHFGWLVTRQAFTDNTPRGKVEFVNLIANFSPSGGAQKSPSFFVCSHYDTKTFDSIRFVGANDGGSSTGALIELARVLALHPALAARITLAFFDGEEAYENFSDTDGLYGSRYFATHLSSKEQRTGGIVLDMIGDRSLRITLSPDSPAKLAGDIFASAEALKVRHHFTYSYGAITDDHTPLNAAGIPTIDLIDFEYPPWHTAEDTMDKISAESLQTIGAVTTYYLSEFAFK